MVLLFLYRYFDPAVLTQAFNLGEHGSHTYTQIVLINTEINIEIINTEIRKEREEIVLTCFSFFYLQLPDLLKLNLETLPNAG